MSQRSQRKPSNILESDKEHANTTSKGKNNWKKKPQSQDRARKNRSNYIHEKSLKKIKKKKTSNGLVKLPGYDTVLVREIHVCVFCLGGQRQELNYAACTRAEFLFCVSKKIWLWGYTYIFYYVAAVSTCTQYWQHQSHWNLDLFWTIVLFIWPKGIKLSVFNKCGVASNTEFLVETLLLVISLGFTSLESIVVTLSSMPEWS